MTSYATLDWRGNLPIARDFDDPYFSLNDGFAETQHVFLAGNDLPQRFREGFHIAELGFGTGLNLLAAWKAWLDAGFQTQLKFTSFEAFPMALKDMEKALSLWPILSEFSGELLDQLDKGNQITTKTLKAKIILGDARKTVPNWEGQADAWFLDGFSPAKNPELWDSDLMNAVGAHTTSSGTFATYTAAGHVRKKLSDAGFVVDRTKGFGHKRHMTRGKRPT